MDGLQELGTREFYVWAGAWAALDDEMTVRAATTIMFVMKWTMYVCVLNYLLAGYAPCQ